MFRRRDSDGESERRSCASPQVGLVKTAGDNQTGDTNSAFAIPLQAMVVDQYNNGVPSASVTFAVVAGSGGASGTFTGSATVTTDANGIATAPLLTANGTVGTFTVTATSGSSTVTFTLTILSATYSLGSPGVTVGPAAGSSQALVVVTPSTAPWNATSNASWLHVTTPSGPGSGLAQFTFDANSGAAVRTGTLSLSGQTFTVTQAGAGYITTNTTSTVVTGLKAPNGMAMDSSGNIYIADTTNKALKKWVPSTNTMTTLVSTGLSAPAGLSIDSAGNVYIADPSAAAIFKVTGTTSTKIISTGLTSPKAVAADNLGNLYIADASTLKMWNGSALTTLVSSGLNAPQGLAFDAAGTLYIADTGNNAIKKYTGGMVSTIPVTTKGPIGMAADGLGNLYYTDATSGSVGFKIYNQATAVVTGFTGLTTPKGLAVDPAGSTVYWANSGTNVVGLLQLAWLGSSSASEPPVATADTVQIIPSNIYTARTSDQSWLTFAAGALTGPVNFNVTQNVSISRTAHITVLGQTVTVTQAAPPAGAAAIMVKLAGDTQSGATGATYLTVLQVQVTDANGIPEPGASVTFTVNNGAGGAAATFADTGTATTTLTANASGVVTATALTANAIAGAFTVSATSGAATASFSLTNASPSFVLQGVSTFVSASAGSGNAFVFVTPSNGSWTASSDSVWLSAAASGTGNVVAFTVTANVSVTPRAGNLTIGGLNFAVTQAGSTDLSGTVQTTPVPSGLSTPYGIAADSAGNAYFADYGHKAIKKVTPAGVVSSLVSAGLSGPVGVAVDASGNVYFTDGSNIKKWTASSGTVSTVVTGLSGVLLIALDSSNNIYYSLAASIGKWNGTAKSTVISGLTDGYGVAVDLGGNVYASDQGTGKLLSWNASTQQTTTLLSGLVEPTGVAVDGVGNLYINQYSASNVSKWSPLTGQLTTLATGSFYPLGVATDPTGSIVYFADDYASTIRKITSAFVGPASFTEPAAAGTDSAHVLPPIASFTPTSTQTWLTANPAASGSLGFSFTTNSTGSAQTGQITALGQTITVTQNPVTMPTITWPTPAGITYGTALSATQLNATASVPGTFSYSPAAGTVLQAGQAQALSVTFTPTDAVSYTTAAGSNPLMWPRRPL